MGERQFPASARKACLAGRLPLHTDRKGASAAAPCQSARSLGSLLILPQAGLSLTCAHRARRPSHLGRAALGTALAGECVHPGADTHLFLPFVTHASATWRRSETLRDRPSPVVPFTVPNKDSVSGTNQHILPARRQRCGAGSETPASEDVTGRNVRGWVQGGRMTCSHLRLRLSLV